MTPGSLRLAPIRPWRRLRAVAVVLALAPAGALSIAGDAHAQAPQEIALARETARDGLLAYKAGEYDKAMQLFQQARALYPSAQILRMTGYTLLALSKWESAAEAMEASLASSIGPLSEADRKDVQEQLAKAMGHLGMVTVTTRLGDAELIVDGGDPLPLPLSKPIRVLAGPHRFTVRSPHEPELTREIEVPGGQTIEVSLDPEAPPKPEAIVVSTPVEKSAAPAPRGRDPWFGGQRTVGFVLVGGAVVVGGAALVTALSGASVRSHVEDDVARHKENFGDACEKNDPRECRYDRAVINQDADRADTLRDASVWMGIGAGVLAAGGIVLLASYPWGGSPKQTGARTASASPPRAGSARSPRPSISCAPTGPAALGCAGTF